MVTANGTMLNEEPGPQKVYVLRRMADARDCASDPRTAAASAAAPKLDSRTFLGNLTQSNSVQQAHDTITYSLKIHDLGKRWLEMSWGKSESRPGKRGSKGQSPNRERNEQRARARAVGEIRRKCITLGADHLVTLTYRSNVTERAKVLADLERLRRMLARAGYPLPYVAVLECQRRGAIHPHLAVRGFQDVRFLRRCWYKIVGKGQGQVNVKGPRPGTSPVKLGRYLSKYISKAMDELPREFEEHRYFCSLGIKVPTERFQIVLVRQAKEVDYKMYRLMFNEVLRRIGDHCTVNHWLGGAGTFGWMAGYEDPGCRWITNRSSPLPSTTPGQGAVS